MSEEKKEEKRLTIAESLQMLSATLVEFKKEVLQKLDEKPAARTSDNLATPAQTTAQTTANQKTIYPIPLAWRDIVNTTLNKDFGIEIEYMSDSPKFQFTIIVPEKYSNMTQAYRQMYGNVDRRPIVLDNAVGENGVRSWAERVFKNLGPEMQALIVNDRVTSM